MKHAILIFALLTSIAEANGQTKTCTSLHIGKFETALPNNQGVTKITRTKDLQIEENKLLGYKLAYTIRWTSDCNYQVKLKKVIKGDPNWLTDQQYVIMVQIKEITKDSYVTEQTSTYSDKAIRNQFKIIQ